MISYLNNLINKIESTLDGHYDIETTHKMILLKLFSLIGTIIYPVFAIIAGINAEIGLVALLLASTIAYGANYFLINNVKRIKEASWIICLVFTIINIYLLVTGQASGTGYVWFVVYPIFSIFLFGLSRGIGVAVVFFIIVGLLAFVPISGVYIYSLDIALKIRLLSAFITTLATTAIYDYLRVKLQEMIERKMLDARNEIRSKDEFISKLSHQIRTPLNNIMVISNLVESTPLDENQKDLIETIQASTNNLVNVVNNIAKVSNVEVMDSKPVNINFDIESTIRSTLKLFSGLGYPNLDIHLNVSPDIDFSLTGDPIRIKQIFLNLIENILKYNDNGRISIQINVRIQSQNENNCELGFSVSTGKFMKELSGKQDYWASTENRSSEEHMQLIDLTIARRLIDISGGSLDILPTTDSTAFTFNLFFRKKHKERPGQPKKEEKAPAPVEETKTNIELKDANVLLVEDNLINQKIVLLSLQKSVRNIDIANNGKEALDKFASSRYDIILMDVQMPVMDGIMATKKIREIEASTNSQTPIIAITANALSGDKENCLAAGMNEYISKPFQVEVLLQKMRNLLSS